MPTAIFWRKSLNYSSLINDYITKLFKPLPIKIVMSDPKRLQDLVQKISTEYFIDQSELRVDGAKPIEAWNTTLLLLNYLFKDNILILGEPGFGKTTAAKIVSTACTGLPFDLYETAQLQGHPEQTKEELIARPDYAKLKDEEKVIWQLGVLLPSIIIDEFNRLPQGKQSVLLNAMATGRFNYLNDTIYQGKTPFFATANHPDDGNHIIIPPMADRFASCIEASYVGPGRRQYIGDAQGRILEDLCDPKLVEQALNELNSKKHTAQAFQKWILEESKGFREKLSKKGLFVPDTKSLAEQIRAVQLSPEAKIFCDSLEAELNYNGKKGPKRSNETIPENDNHMGEIASSKVKSAVSPRAFGPIEAYAQAIAYLTGAKQVEKRHIAAVAPYILSHRLNFTDDFRAAHEEDDRCTNIWYNAPSENLFLAMKLVEGVDANYVRAVKPHSDLLLAFYEHPEQLSKSQKEEASKLVGNAHSLDNPLIRSLAHDIKKFRA